MTFAGLNKGLLVALAALLPVLSGCGSYRPAPKAFHEATIQPYRLDAGDRLRIETPGGGGFGRPGGNVLLAFAPAVRLDVHADELKRKANDAGPRR